jgi:hypothetical protein
MRRRGNSAQPRRDGKRRLAREKTVRPASRPDRYEIRHGCHRTVQRERPAGRVALRPRSRCSGKRSADPPNEQCASLRSRCQRAPAASGLVPQPLVVPTVVRPVCRRFVESSSHTDDESPVIPRRTDPAFRRPQAGPGSLDKFVGRTTSEGQRSTRRDFVHLLERRLRCGAAAV